MRTHLTNRMQWRTLIDTYGDPLASIVHSGGYACAYSVPLPPVMPGGIIHIFAHGKCTGSTNTRAACTLIGPNAWSLTAAESYGLSSVTATHVSWALDVYVSAYALQKQFVRGTWQTVFYASSNFSRDFSVPQHAMIGLYDNGLTPITLEHIFVEVLGGL